MPFLLRWLRIIKEWSYQAGFSDFNIRLEQRRQAIEEVIDQCRKSDLLWKKALISADLMESEEDFSAPPFWTGM